MTVLEELHQAQQRLVDRLEELAPLVAEYEQLQAEAVRLGLISAGTASAPTSAKEKPRSRSARGSKQQRRKKTTQKAKSGDAATVEVEASPTPLTNTKRARSGAKRRAGQSRQRSGGRSEDVLRLVSQHPGMTIREIGEELGVNPTGLYAPVRRLVDSGRLAKTGSKLEATPA